MTSLLRNVAGVFLLNGASDSLSLSRHAMLQFFMT